jgi:hypothetical protein
MMPTRKSDSSGVRAPRRTGRRRSRGGLGPIIGVVVLLVAVAVAVVLVSRPKPVAGTGKDRKSSAAGAQVEGETRRSSRSKGIKVARKRADREARRAERKEKKRASKRARRRVIRSDTKSSGRSGGSRSSRVTGSRSTRRVEAILVDRGGQRYALVNARPVKIGDVVDGRRISSVDAEQVKVEYGGQTYTVRIGQNLY